MIEGFEIGHHTADGDGWLTGTTVVLARAGAVGGVDVRGGGPGTRETDLLDPRAVIEQVHAVVLTGGSAYGLATADGVMQELEARRLGFPVGPSPDEVVPIVPAAVCAVVPETDAMSGFPFVYAVMSRPASRQAP